MTDITYGEKIIESRNKDGTTTIRREGYFKGLNSIKEQIRIDKITNKQAILTDLIQCLELLKSDSPEVVIVIKKDKYGEPALIQKTYTTVRKKL